jgi:toxin ParE1/3/4
MANYFLTNKAVEDLSQIWNYTGEAWSERQADKYYELLINSFQEISKNPGTGKIYREIGNEIRGVQVGKHIVFYRLTGAVKVEIIRMLHQQMDLKNRMDE